jgi:hypothetical protein
MRKVIADLDLLTRSIAKARKWFTLNESPTFVPTENFIETGIRAATRICIESMRLSETSCDPNHSSRPAIEIENHPIHNPDTTADRRPCSRSSEGIGYNSGCEAFVAMMQAANLRNGDHVSDQGWHDRARVRTILVERKMSAGMLVIVDIRG